MFGKGLFKFTILRYYGLCCPKKNTKRNHVIDFVKESLSIFHLQKKLNELELIKYLLLDEKKLHEIREFNKFGDAKMFSLIYDEFNKSDVNSTCNSVKALFDEKSIALFKD